MDKVKEEALRVRGNGTQQPITETKEAEEATLTLQIPRERLGDRTIARRVQSMGIIAEENEEDKAPAAQEDRPWATQVRPWEPPFWTTAFPLSPRHTYCSASMLLASLTSRVPSLACSGSLVRAGECFRPGSP
jgi:hypothetical protein